MRAFVWAVTMVLIGIVCGETAIAQTTAFTYQGKLTDGGSPAAGSYQMEFKLFNAASGGTQLGATIADVPVTATAGVFTTQLDFGASPFAGGGTWLEIGVRHNSAEAYTAGWTEDQRVSAIPHFA
jgi:hypothetical protein